MHARIFGRCIARGVYPKGIFGPNDSMASARHCGSQLIMPDTPGQDVLKSIVLFTDFINLFTTTLPQLDLSRQTVSGIIISRPEIAAFSHPGPHLSLWSGEPLLKRRAEAPIAPPPNCRSWSLGSAFASNKFGSLVRSSLSPYLIFRYFFISC